MIDINVIKWTGIYFLAKIGFISQYTLPLARYNESNDLPTFLCLPNNTICQRFENTLLFPIQLLRSTQNAYHTLISWGFGTDNSRWGRGLENTVDMEAIRNPIYAYLPAQCLMCEMVHCHHEKEFFSFSNVAFSSWFRQPIDPIMQLNMLQ